VGGGDNDGARGGVAEDHSAGTSLLTSEDDGNSTRDDRLAELHHGGVLLGALDLLDGDDLSKSLLGRLREGFVVEKLLPTWKKKEKK
jgi:hypothetical protein